MAINEAMINRAIANWEMVHDHFQVARDLAVQVDGPDCEAVRRYDWWISEALGALADLRGGES